MDYIAGDHLDEYINKKQLPIREILKLFAEICDAVNYAHHRGVIHRDLKPSNILVDEDGQPHIIDFGLAKLGVATPGETEQVSFTGLLMGTLNYMSPEQASGQPDAIDNRSDVYSLAVILYRLITGHLPYELDASLSKNLLTIQHASPLPMIGVPNEVATIILKGLSKEPDRRYQLAGDLGRDIGRFLRGETIDAKRDSILYVLRKTAQRHRVAVGASILFAVLIVTSTIVGWALYLNAVQAWNAESVASLNYQQERDTAQELREESQRQLYFAKMNLAGQVTSELFGTDTVRAALESWVPASEHDVDLRGWEWYYLNGLSHQEQSQSELLPGWSWEAEYNPDCSEYVVGINGWGLQVREARTKSIS